MRLQRLELFPHIYEGVVTWPAVLKTTKHYNFKRGPQLFNAIIFLFRMFWGMPCSEGKFITHTWDMSILIDQTYPAWKNEKLHPTIMKGKKNKNDPIILLSISIMLKRIINVSKLDVIEENLKLLQREVSFSPIWCWVAIMRDSCCQRKWRSEACILSNVLLLMTTSHGEQ